MADSIIILECMIWVFVMDTDAKDFCNYLKFITQKATSFKAQGILDFDDDLSWLVLQAFATIICTSARC